MRLLLPKKSTAISPYTNNNCSHITILYNPSRSKVDVLYKIADKICY